MRATMRARALGFSCSATKPSGLAGMSQCNPAAPAATQPTVASQFHDPPSIEPYSSGLVGAERGIVLGKKSGLDSIRIKAEELGLDVPEDRRAELLAKVKELGTRKRGLVTDAEFRELADG